MSSAADRAANLKHSSMHKGLTNHIGQNNCFLNVIIQSLWHLDSFRVLIKSSDHTTFHTIHDTCLLCELKEIFTYYEFSEERALAPDNVRLALNMLSAQSDRFQLGAMGDATETLDTIFASMHADQCRHVAATTTTTSLESSIEIKDTACDPKCIAHALFESNMFDMYHCTTCNATSEPDMWKDTLYRVYFAELYPFVETKASSSFFGAHSPTSNAKHTFESVLKKLLNEGPRKSCPESESDHQCTGRCQVERWLMKFPIVFAVSIVWPANQIGGKELKAFANIIPHELDLGLIFRLGGDAAGLAAAESIYLFRGMVCYYGQHYVSFFKSQSTPHRWYLFDDVNVRIVGPWDEVRRLVERGCYQPTILFWEKNQLAYETLETLAQEVHQQTLSPLRSPQAASAALPPLIQPTVSSSSPPRPVKLSPPKPRGTLACHVFTNNVAHVTSPIVSPSRLEPAQVDTLAALDSLDELDGVTVVQDDDDDSDTTSIPWTIVIPPVAASDDGTCIFKVQLTAQDGGLGLVVAPHTLTGRLIVTEVEASGRPLPALACGAIAKGDELIAIDGDVIDESWTASHADILAAGPVDVSAVHTHQRSPRVQMCRV
ncbi:Aste57867_23514 [Aphanomyces stellatus]|uniref:Aste57867_23514 protein n=1 Tax=Aphanomyces stellatus TaxID=120398 RepID=A0A485LNY2_9STRA|nr:hypothetical protein As57867_023443 [Aphanomyces stellatus]VFU00159.1 Aste57867_23514 [Aphanomyces stellatus]